MFSEILKIKPQLDNSDLQKMENTLNARFKRIAKSFGGGIMAVLKGGGVAGIVLALIDKILNPLKEVQDAIDKMLKSSDDIATNAQQFGTTTGKLYKLIILAKSAGLDQDGLFTLLTKFQGSLAQAKADPTNPANAAVKNFTGTPDQADAFFQFMTSLQKMDKNQQVLVQQAVFGEKQILKMADFLQTDFPKRLGQLGIDQVKSQKYGSSIDKLADLNDLTDILTAKREADDTIKKSSIITEGMVRSKDAADKLALEKENKRIAAYESMLAVSETVEKLLGIIENLVILIGDFLTWIKPVLDKILGFLAKITNSRFLRGIFEKEGK